MWFCPVDFGYERTNERFPQSYQGPQGPTRGTRNTHIAYLSLRAQTAYEVKMDMLTRSHSVEAYSRTALEGPVGLGKRV